MTKITQKSVNFVVFMATVGGSLKNTMELITENFAVNQDAGQSENDRPGLNNHKIICCCPKCDPHKTEEDIYDFELGWFKYLCESYPQRVYIKQYPDGYKIHVTK